VSTRQLRRPSTRPWHRPMHPTCSAGRFSQRASRLPMLAAGSSPTPCVVAAGSLPCTLCRTEDFLRHQPMTTMQLRQQQTTRQVTPTPRHRTRLHQLTPTLQLTPTPRHHTPLRQLIPILQLMHTRRHRTRLRQLTRTHQLTHTRRHHTRLRQPTRRLTRTRRHLRVRSRTWHHLHLEGVSRR